MEINLNELMAIPSALINVKMFSFQERKIDTNKPTLLVDDTYAVVMTRTDS
jgi:hypothetical protein